MVLQADGGIGCLTKAAELGTSQPALTRHVMRLELRSSSQPSQEN
jgi:hypothetical protein